MDSENQYIFKTFMDLVFEDCAGNHHPGISNKLKKLPVP